MVLTIHNVSKTDIGTYSCVASNTMGKSEASVRIYGKNISLCDEIDVWYNWIK